MKVHNSFVPSLLLSFALALPLHAAEAPDAAAVHKQLFGRPLGTGKAHACFRRLYDSAHLSRHPQQNVRAMTLLVTAQPGDGTADTAASYELILGMSFRREGAHFETVGNCRSLFPPPAHCGIDCDGGSLDVSMKSTDTVLVGIPERARIWQAGTDSEDETGPYHKRFGTDDKLFRLERTSLKDCLDLVSDPADKAALRRR